MRIPDEAKLWFVDFHVYLARVHGKPLAHNIRRAKHLVPELFGPVVKDPFRRLHDGGASDQRCRPPVDLPPFALSRLAWRTHAIAARLNLSVPTWHHVYRRVLRELDIEFEPSRRWTRQFLQSLQLSWKLAATSTRPSEAHTTRERNLLQLRVIYLRDRFGISQDRIWDLDETAVRMVPSGERGWTQKAESACVFASRASVTVTLGANMRGGMWTQFVFEGKSDRVQPHGPLCPRQLVSHSPTHWITQEALLDMIDAIDADMHARAGDAELTPWLLLFDCAPKHATSEFRSIVRDSGPNCATPSGTSRDTLSRWTGRTCAQLDPPRGSQTLRRVLLGSQLRTCRSGLQYRSHSCTQSHRTQTARNIEPPGWRFIDRSEVEQRELLAEAKRLLETGELFPRGIAEEPDAPDAEAEASDSEPEAHVMEPLADDHSSDGEDTPTGVADSATPAAPAVAAAPERGAMSLLERLQAIRIIYGSKPPS